MDEVSGPSHAGSKTKNHMLEVNKARQSLESTTSPDESKHDDGGKDYNNLAFDQ